MRSAGRIDPSDDGNRRHKPNDRKGFKSGAGRGTRTPTTLSGLRILSPLRLPVSPSRQGKGIDESGTHVEVLHGSPTLLGSLDGRRTLFQSRTAAALSPIEVGEIPVCAELERRATLASSAETVYANYMSNRGNAATPPPLRLARFEMYIAWSAAA